MTLDLSDLATIIGMTSAITTASTLVIVVRIKDSLKTDFCNQVQTMKEEWSKQFNDVLVRLGIVENEIETQH